MPILQTERQRKKIFLEVSSTPEEKAWIEVYETVLAEDMVELGDLSDQQKEFIYYVLARIITDWNFTDKDKNKLPIEKKYIRLLPFEDIMIIMQEIPAFAKFLKMPNAKKNDSSFTLPQKMPEKKTAI